MNNYIKMVTILFIIILLSLRIKETPSVQYPIHNKESVTICEGEVCKTQVKKDGQVMRIKYYGNKELIDIVETKDDSKIRTLIINEYNENGIIHTLKALYKQKQGEEMATLYQFTDKVSQMSLR